MFIASNLIAHIVYYINVQMIIGSPKRSFVMSIKGKLATIAIQRISEKVIHGDKVESAINSAVTRISKATGQKSSACFLQEAQKCS